MQPSSYDTLTWRIPTNCQEASSIAAVAPQIDSFAQIVAGRNNVYSTILGVTSDFLAVRNCSLDWGDFISSSDQNRRARVAVLGAEVAYDLFGYDDPVGQTIKINSYNYTLSALGGQGNTSSESRDYSFFCLIYHGAGAVIHGTTKLGRA
jgi:putative ABC transport system permease protein